MDETALKAFQEVFTAFEYPFQSADMLLEKMDSGARAMYFERAKTLSEDSVLQTELIEWKRTFYAKLALQSINETERTAYRTVLIGILLFEKRLLSLAARVKQLELRKIADDL